MLTHFALVNHRLIPLPISTPPATTTDRVSVDILKHRQQTCRDCLDLVYGVRPCLDHCGLFTGKFQIASPSQMCPLKQW